MQMDSTNPGPGKKIFNILTILLVITTILFFTISWKFQPSFVMKYSPDGILKQETLNKISLMQDVFFFLAFAPLLIICLMLHFRISFTNFLTRKREIIFNVLTLICVLIIFLAFSELILWALLNDETSYSATGPSSVKFNREYVKLNKAGFRDYEFSIEKEENTTRIIVIGDSLSFGSGVRNVSDTYSKLLEKMLNEKDSKKDYEVYNFGIPGYDAEDELEVIKKKAINYKPDIIIIEYYENDLENVDPDLSSVENIENWEIPVFGFWLREISYTYYFFESRVNRFAENAGLKRRWLDTLEATYNSEENQKYNKKLYKEMGDIAKEDEAVVVFVVFPVISDFSEYKFKRVHEFAREIAEENNFYFIDLLEEFERYTPEELSVNKYDYHPNEKGHQIASQAILENFINRGII